MSAPSGLAAGSRGEPVHDLWSPIKDDNIDNKTHADFIVRNIMETVRYYRPHVPHECGLITDKPEWRPDTGELKPCLDDSIGVQFAEVCVLIATPLYHQWPCHSLSGLVSQVASQRRSEGCEDCEVSDPGPGFSAKTITAIITGEVTSLKQTMQWKIVKILIYSN